MGEVLRRDLRETCRTGVERANCSTCNKSFSQRLGKCPSCFPDSKKQSNVSKQADADAKLAKWRNFVPAPMQRDVPWSETSEMMWCHGGSGGAFLLSLPTGAISLKGERCTPQLLFAQRLADALAVRTARLRVVCKDHQEHASIVNALRNAEPTFEDHRFQTHRVSKAENITVMEYVAGCAMMGMPAHERLQEVRYAGGLWRGLGRLMAFDLLINNFDRLPLAWSNDGNLGNVMLSSVSGEVVGIDQSVQPITNAEGLGNYDSRVRKVCERLRSGTGDPFAGVKQAIYNNTAVELSADENGHLGYGCLDLLEDIARMNSSGSLTQILETISDQVASELSSDSQVALRLCSDLVCHVACVVEDALADSTNT